MTTRKTSYEAQHQNFDTPHRAYPMERVSTPKPIAQENRYLQRVRIERVETNDSSVSLNGMIRTAYDVLGLVLGIGAAAWCVYWLPGTVSFAVKAVIAILALFVGYMFVKTLSGEDDASRD